MIPQIRNVSIAVQGRIDCLVNDKSWFTGNLIPFSKEKSIINLNPTKNINNTWSHIYFVSERIKVLINYSFKVLWVIIQQASEGNLASRNLFYSLASHMVYKMKIS